MDDPFMRALAPGVDVSGLDPRFRTALGAMFAEMPTGLRVNSGFRTPERQSQLFRQAVAKYGSEDAARKWVAPPGKSQHNHGNAVDLGFGNDEARTWAHANAGRFGLNFPMAHEPWHIELNGARGNKGPVNMMAQAQSAPGAQIPAQEQIPANPMMGRENSRPGMDLMMLAEGIRNAMTGEQSGSRLIRGRMA